VTHWRKLGEHFGFPTCCIDNFVAMSNAGLMTGREMVARDPQGPWIGTGFVPCHAHLEALRGKTAADVAALISNRKHSLPFPHTDDLEVDNVMRGMAFATS